MGSKVQKSTMSKFNQIQFGGVNTTETESLGGFVQPLKQNVRSVSAKPNKQFDPIAYAKQHNNSGVQYPKGSLAATLGPDPMEFSKQSVTVEDILENTDKLLDVEHSKNRNRLFEQKIKAQKEFEAETKKIFQYTPLSSKK